MTTGLLQSDPNPPLTRQHGDADGALLAEGLHGGMLGQAGVLSFIPRAHLLQRQRRGRQDPVVALREKVESCRSQTNTKRSRK